MHSGLAVRAQHSKQFGALGSQPLFLTQHIFLNKILTAPNISISFQLKIIVNKFYTAFSIK